MVCFQSTLVLKVMLGKDEESENMQRKYAGAALGPTFMSVVLPIQTALWYLIDLYRLLNARL